MIKGKILVMDDEDLVRTVTGKMLEYLGYQVVLAKNGEEALNLYQTHQSGGHSFDAAILDWLVSDGMDGYRTMEALLQIDPAAKGVLASGFNQGEESKRLSSLGFSGIIDKPYELKSLEAILASVLGKR